MKKLTKTKSFLAVACALAMAPVVSAQQPAGAPAGAAPAPAEKKFYEDLIKTPIVPQRSAAEIQNDLKTAQLAPYSLRLSGDRVTDENATMTFLAPEHPVLNTPNKITQADFDGWVQERGIYFPNQWDEHFTPILACNDPGESPLKGGLLVAQYGKGYFVYTGLVFFRELPAGMPGAYRLFANLISLGK